MPKAAKLGARQNRRRIGEEGVVGRVGARPAALDIVDAQLVQFARNGHLVRHREIDALRLRSVAQRACRTDRSACRSWFPELTW
jgi:hypothetical protein